MKSSEDSISVINSFLFSGGCLSKIQKHCFNVIDVIFTDEICIGLNQIYPRYAYQHKLEFQVVGRILAHSVSLHSSVSQTGLRRMFVRTLYQSTGQTLNLKKKESKLLGIISK